MNKENPKRLVVISAPSGCGKTTIVKEILKMYSDFYFSVSATTRPKRANEINGVDYKFLTTQQFETFIQKNKLVEWEKIYDNYYGTLVDEVESNLANGKLVIFDIDVLGALSIKEKYPDDSLMIFIDIPSVEALKERLKNRKTESEETFSKRLKRMEMEFDKKKYFDYVVMNQDLEKAVIEVEEIILNNCKINKKK